MVGDKKNAEHDTDAWRPNPMPGEPGEPGTPNHMPITLLVSVAGILIAICLL